MYGHGKHIVIVDVYNDADENDETINGRLSGEEQQAIPALLKPAPSNDFVTVVKVDEPNMYSSGYVTVLQVSDGVKDDEVEEVTIYRLPGERLGMALKFEGGVNAADNVSRVFIQSINMDSPAARAESALGSLHEGDEILKIDGREVASMTRMDCVSLLRHAPVCIRMVVRRQTVLEPYANGEEQEPILPKKKKGPPPPVPPRKSPAISQSQQDMETMATVREVVQRLEERTANADRMSIKRPVHPPPLPPRRPKTAVFVEDDIENSLKPNFPGASLSTKLPGWEELLMRRAGKLDEIQCDLPARADIYMDVIAEEDEKQIMESESDDTGSSVSTIIERFSRTSTANSSFSEHSHSVDRTTYDLNQVLSPFEQLERELDGEVSADDVQHESTDTITIDPPESFQDTTHIEDNDLLINFQSEEESEKCAELDKIPESQETTKDTESVESSEDTNSEFEQGTTECNLQREQNETSEKLSEGSGMDSVSPRKRTSIPPPIPPRRTKVEECSPKTYTGTSKIPRPTYRKLSPSSKTNPSPSSRIPSNPVLWKRRRVEVSTTVVKSVKSIKKDKSISIQGTSTSQGYKEEFRSVKSASKEVCENRKSGYISTSEIAFHATREQEVSMENNSSNATWDFGWQASKEKTESSTEQPNIFTEANDLLEKDSKEMSIFLQDEQQLLTNENMEENLTSEDFTDYTTQCVYNSEQSASAVVEFTKAKVEADEIQTKENLEISEGQSSSNEEEIDNDIQSAVGTIPSEESKEDDRSSCNYENENNVEDQINKEDNTEAEKQLEKSMGENEDTNNSTGNKGEEKMEIMSYPEEQYLPPTVYRQPPDGHEFPPNYTESTVVETKLEDSGVFLEESMKTTNQQYVVYPADFPESKQRNSSENKSLAALDELIHGKHQQVVIQEMIQTSDDINKMKIIEEVIQDNNELLKKSNETVNRIQEKENTVNDDNCKEINETKCDSKKIDNDSLEAKSTIEEKSLKLTATKQHDIYEKTKNGHTAAISKISEDKKQSCVQSNVNSRWKSEENLRYDRISSRASRNNEAQVSVKDRIAMFSRSEVSLNNSTKPSQNVEETIKENQKAESKSLSHFSGNYSLRDCKWHSTGNISSTVGNKEKSDFVHNSNMEMTNSLTAIPDEVDAEQPKKAEVVSSYPQTQWSRYQRYNYSGSNYPRRLEDCYKRFSSGSLFSPLDKKQSKLKGLIIPEKPANYTTVSKTLPTIVSCSSVLLNKLEVPKSIQNKSEFRTEQNNLLLSTDCKESHLNEDVKKCTLSQLMESSWKQANNALPKYSPAFKRRSLQLPRTATPSSTSPTPPSSLTSPLSPPPSSPSSICSSSSSLQKQDVFHLLAGEVTETNNRTIVTSSNTNFFLPENPQVVSSGKYLAQPVSVSESKTVYESPEEISNKDNTKIKRNKLEEWSAITRWARQTEQDDDDSTSSTSQQTEDSRHLADDSMSETNSDSEFHPRYLSHQRTVLRTTLDSTDSVRNFRALAEKWAQRSGDSSDALSPTPIVSPTHTLKRETERRGSQDNNTKLPPSLKPRCSVLDNGVKLREKKTVTTRPASLIDSPRCAGGLRKLELTESCESLNRLVNHRGDSNTRQSSIGHASKSLSVSDIRKTFEQPEIQPVSNGIKSNHFKRTIQMEQNRLKIDHSRMSSIDSTCSEQSTTEVDGSELTVVLRKPHSAGSIGITLAGGTDCEVKDITIHKVIIGSLADRDGRLKKGDRIITVNSQQLHGLTHREAQALLKVPCDKVELVVLRSQDSIILKHEKPNQISDMILIEKNDMNVLNKNHLVVELQKEGTGLGFGIEGGKDSPVGDKPLTIKRIFKGGVADREGRLKAGDELISINGQSVGNMTRTEAWNFMKKLPDGLVAVAVQVS